jgi:hypothetical protein
MNQKTHTLEKRLIKPKTPISKADLSSMDLKAKIKSEVKQVNLIKVTNRDLAKMFVYAIIDNCDLKPDEIEIKVNDYLLILEDMPKNQKLALKCAYVFASKVPLSEREDFYQELALCLLKAKVKDEALAYTITRCNWLDFWRDFKRQQQYYGGSLEGLDSNEIERAEYSDLDSKDKRTIREYLTGICEYEQIDAKIDAQTLWSKLPQTIKPIIAQRISGQPTTSTQRMRLKSWLDNSGMKLIKRCLTVNV